MIFIIITFLFYFIFCCFLLFYVFIILIFLISLFLDSIIPISAFLFFYFSAHLLSISDTERFLINLSFELRRRMLTHTSLPQVPSATGFHLILLFHHAGNPGSISGHPLLGSSAARGNPHWGGRPFPLWTHAQKTRSGVLHSWWPKAGHWGGTIRWAAAGCSPRLPRPPGAPR